jgi:hypothetical protein
MRNIMVDGTRISGLLDWENSRIAPLFQDGGPPEFLHEVSDDPSGGVSDREILLKYFAAETRRVIPEWDEPMNGELFKYIRWICPDMLNLVNGGYEFCLSRLNALERDWQTFWGFSEGLPQWQHGLA